MRIFKPGLFVVLMIVASAGLVYAASADVKKQSATAIIPMLTELNATGLAVQERIVIAFYDDEDDDFSDYYSDKPTPAQTQTEATALTEPAVSKPAVSEQVKKSDNADTAKQPEKEPELNAAKVLSQKKDTTELPAQKKITADEDDAGKYTDSGNIAADRRHNPRFQTVEKLLTVSTAARTISGSDNAEAKKLHADALELFEQAKTAANEGDDERVKSLLGKATKLLFSATRMVKKKGDFKEKYLRDFDMRLASVEALSEAYHNIRKEKGLGEPEDSELFPFVQKKIEVAKKLKQQDRLKEGRKILDQAYVAAKVAIEGLRGGETLVRSLNFETPKDEYHYEIDRNDTHTMLVTVLLKEKIEASDRVKNMVDKFMAKAKVLRQKADEQAENGEYETAITTLEQSTKEIVRAIRSAGVFIPG